MQEAIPVDWIHKLERLEREGWSVQVEKGNAIVYQSRDPMLKPLYICLTTHSQELAQATVIDKIVGRAAAFLCILGKVSRVITLLASRSAEEVLRTNGIELQALRIVPQIMARNLAGPCPMEILAEASGTPEVFLAELQRRMGASFNHANQESR